MTEYASNPRRQCWTCLKRRLVCDFEKPSCKKCQSAGMECGGYGEKKPLKWLEPGKVTSKKRTRRLKPEAETGSNDTAQNGSNSSALVVTASPAALVGSRSSGRSASDAEKIQEAKSAWLKDHEERRARITDLLLAKRVQEALKVKEEEFDSEHVEVIPRFDLRDDTTEIVQAVEFYNAQMYPMMQDCFAMSPSPHIIFFPVKALPHLPPVISHAMVGFVLSFTMQRQKRPDQQLWAKIYHHRGRAIHDLSTWIGRCNSASKQLDVQQKRIADATISCILTFLCGEIQHCISVEWRAHVNCMTRLIALRGGLTRLWHEAPPVRSSLIIYIMITTFANTTSPPSYYIELAEHGELIELLNEMYDEVFSYCLCPWQIFQDILCINRLRHQVATGVMTDAAGQLVALELLMRIDSFSPKQWADSRLGFHNEFVLCSSVWKVAAMLYCIFSLQSLSLLLPTPQLRAMRAANSDRLMSLLSRACKVKRLKFFMTWPTLVAGVVAAQCGLASQSWVEQALEEVSAAAGTSSPLLGRSVLRKFWKAEKTAWDDCWTGEYALVC